MGTITCELEASYASGTAGDDDKGTTIPHQQRRRLTFTGNGKGKGRRLGDGGGGGTLWLLDHGHGAAACSFAVGPTPASACRGVREDAGWEEPCSGREPVRHGRRGEGQDPGQGARRGGRAAPRLLREGPRRRRPHPRRLRRQEGSQPVPPPPPPPPRWRWRRRERPRLALAPLLGNGRRSTRDRGRRRRSAPVPPRSSSSSRLIRQPDPAFVLAVWAIAVGGVNLITAGTARTSGKTSSGGARSALSKAAASFARQNIAVLGASAASTAAAGITSSGADPIPSFVCFVLFLGAMSLTLFLVFAAGRHLDGGGSRKTSGRGTSTAAAGTGSSRRVTAVGLLTALVAVGTSLSCFFPEPKAAGAGGLTLAMLLFSWCIAVAGVNMIAAGVCLILTGSGRGESLSCTVRRKASAFAGQNLGVLGVAAASSAAAGVIVSGADADGWVYCFAWFSRLLVAMSGVTVAIVSHESS